MIDEGNEVPVKKQQWHPLLDAESRYDDVGGLADGDSLLAKRTVIVRTFFSHSLPEHLVLIQGQKGLLCHAIVAVITNALKNFQKYQITDRGSTFDDTRIERVTGRQIP